MKKERFDCSFLLNNLRYAYFNYDVNKDSKGRNSFLANNYKFSIVYCLAYRTLYRMDSIDPADNMDNYYIAKALSDYGIFNSFMNNCINEYNIYGDVGTGKISYAPYESLALYIFNSPTRKKTFMDFIIGDNKSLDNEDSPKKKK